MSNLVSGVRRREITCCATEARGGGGSLPVDPMVIAKGREITVMAWEPKELGIAGFLMKRGDAFGIGYSSTLKNQGFINFTVGHELGHYFLPGHVEGLFRGGEGQHFSRSGFISADPREREADLFAVELLMPEELFVAAARRAGEGFAAIERLSGDCRTSLTATAIRYAELAEAPVAVIVSAGEVIEFCTLSSALREGGKISWREKGDYLPQGSATAIFNRSSEKVTAGARVESTSSLVDWFEGAPDVEVKEDVVGLGQYGKTLTVLFTNETVDLDDEDPEDELPSERWRRR